MKKTVKVLVPVVLLIMIALSADAGEKNNKAEQLFKAKCSVCHSYEIPLNMKKDRKAWEEVVKLMQSKKPGFISDQDAITIVDFLVLNAGNQYR